MREYASAVPDEAGLQVRIPFSVQNKNPAEHLLCAARPDFLASAENTLEITALQMRHEYCL